MDVKSAELEGPWSEPTNDVTMPADMAAYAMNKTPTGVGSKRVDQVHFQVVRWNPEDGVTVYRDFDSGPGDVVGEAKSTAIPQGEREKPKNKLIDFNSRQLVLDTSGGMRPIDKVGVPGTLDMPAVSLLMRHDGTILIRSETLRPARPRPQGHGSDL